MMKRSFWTKSALLLVVCLVASVLAGCGGKPLFGSNLEKGDKLFEQGKYQEAMKYYMAAAEEYNARLGKTYSNLEDAKKDAMKVVEAYFKTGMTAEKLNDPSARGMFEKALKDSYTVTEQYYVSQTVHIEAGYVDKWIPGEYKEVYQDGHYEDVYVDGGYDKVWVDGHYEEQYVDGYYRSDGTYVDGYYRKVWKDGYYKEVKKDGYYKKVWVDGKYVQKYIDGHYEKVWVPAHDEVKQIAKTRQTTIQIDSPYSVQAKTKLGAPASSTSSAPAAPQGDDATVKAAYDRMTAAYQKWSAAGTPASGPLFDEMAKTKADYQKLTSR